MMTLQCRCEKDRGVFLCYDLTHHNSSNRCSISHKLFVLVLVVTIGILVSSGTTIKPTTTSDLSSHSSSSSFLVFALSAATGSPLSASKLSSNPTSNTNHSLRTVLVTGGAGYIGSHTCLELLLQKHDNENDNNGRSNYRYKVIVVDNLDNSSEESLRRVRQLLAQHQQQESSGDSDSNTDSNCEERLIFRQCDIRDKDGIELILQEFPDISSCIHFAGLKAVGESVSNPLLYYHCNIAGTITLLQLLQQYNVKHFVFSSSATVYGEPEVLPITEDAKLQATNPYGRTKLFIEEILRDCYAAQPTFWNTLILRYFNPIGAHPSGQIGEDPQGIPNNLMPFIAQVCVGRRKELSIFGNDYPTPDGTGVRDYIHVVDLAKGHVAALETLYTTPDLGCRAVNLGTGKGISVLELVEGMRKATGTPIPYVVAPRRPGDVATVYADPSTAQELLHWKATLDVNDMCTDTWRWQSTNPYGYETAKIQESSQNDNEEKVLEVTETK